MSQKVIVAITTYNLKDYIRQCLDSVLSQETSFEFSLIIADDCSKDGTVEILKEYKTKYPNKIELILNPKNLGSLATSNLIFDKIDCEYFSFLDGDDYWLDNKRLQKQVDFLDSHPDYTLCGGNTHYLVNDKIASDVVKKNLTNKSYTFDDFINDKCPFVHTSSLLVRNVIFKDGLPECYKTSVNTFENCALRGEDFRRLIHHEKGKLFVSNEYYSVYRIHKSGTWQGASSVHKDIESAIAANFYRKYFGDKYKDFFERFHKAAYKQLLKTLLLEDSLYNGYTLSEKDNQLLQQYLNDIRVDQPIKKQGKLFKFVTKVIFKIFK